MVGLKKQHLEMGPLRAVALVQIGSAVISGAFSLVTRSKLAWM